jgi:hypothetical protein
VKVSRASLLRATGALALAALLALPSVAGAVGNAGGAVASLTDLRVGVHPDHTRIVIETDGSAPFVVDPTDREVLVHVDAAATAEAVTARSPHLIWVKVEPTALGADVRIQLKQPVEVKSLVLTRPDRIVLDLYPKAGVAEPEPLPAPEVLPEEEAQPVVAEAEPEVAPEPEAAPEEEPGLPEEETGEPLVLQPPQAEAGEAAPEAEGEPAEAGEEIAAEPVQPSEEGEGPAAAPAETARKPGAPTTPVAPAPSGSRFGSPFALGATALVLLVLFVWLRRRLRAGEPRRMPIPEEEPAPFEPPVRAVAVGEGAETGESVFDVEPDALAPAREEVPTLRPPVDTGLDAQDEAERRIAHLEKRTEELAEAKERLERQIAAQTEELRVQRAAIARTQRVLRSIAPKGDEEPSEPLVRG